MRMRLVMVILLVLVVGTGGYAVVKYVVDRPPSHPRPLDAGAMAAQLQLTAEQKQRIGAMNAEFQRQRAEFRERRIALGRQLMALIEKHPQQRQRINEKIEQISQLQKKMQRLAVDHLIEVSAELHEQQRERLFELMEEAICPGAVMGKGR